MMVCDFVFAGFSSQRERQAQREDALELTEKLDQDWKEIQILVSRKPKKSEDKEKKEKPQVGSTLRLTRGYSDSELIIC